MVIMRPNTRLLFQFLQRRDVSTSGVSAKFIKRSDYQPGSYPETPEEYAAAAKKYHMALGDYKPYPKGHPFCLGDYPMLPLVEEEYRDYNVPWEDLRRKRHWNEPIQLEVDLATESTWSPNVDEDHLKYWWMFSIPYLTLLAVMYYLFKLDDYMGPLTMPKQMLIKSDPHQNFRYRAKEGTALFEIGDPVLRNNPHDDQHYLFERVD